MSILSAPRPSVKSSPEPITAPAPDPARLSAWDGRGYVNQFALTFGVKVTLQDHEGVYRVVREAEMVLDGHFRVRVRRLADNGSLVGPVLSVRYCEFKAIVRDEPKVEAPEPTPAPAPILPASSCPRHEACRAFDPIYHLGLAEVAVAEERAMWLTSKPEPADPDPDPDHARDIVLIDDDGTPLETASAMDRRHRDEHAALVAVTELRADWLSDAPAARQVEDVPCCRPSEAKPCQACATVHTPLPDEPARVDDDAIPPSEGPTPEDWRDFGEWSDEVDARTWDARLDAEDDGPAPEGDDDHVWNAIPPDEMTMAARVDHEALGYRAWGTDLGDLLADRMEGLAAQMRLLEAKTPEQFVDRRDAMIDSAVSQAEARAAAARCC